MRAAGLVFDEYPEQLHLYEHPVLGNDPEYVLCMLLSDSAHPERWDLRDVFGPQLLRPYDTPCPSDQATARGGTRLPTNGLSPSMQPRSLWKAPARTAFRGRAPAPCIHTRAT